MNTKQIGNHFEDRAVCYLKDLGFTILERNYRFKNCEVDVIALDDLKSLLFIEVKYRSITRYGFPEAFLSKEQFSRIQMAADNYTFEKGFVGMIRFDLIAMTQEGLVHFKDLVLD